MPIPLLIPLVIGKLAFAGGVSLLGHKFAMKLQSPRHYASKTPEFVPETDLCGKMIHEGLIHGPTGKVDKKFVATYFGEWVGAFGRLTSTTEWDDGTQETGNWTLERNDNKLSIQGSGIKGIGEGILSGNSLKLSYKICLDIAKTNQTLSVEDWYFKMPNDTLIRRGQISKLGFPLADIAGSMRKDNS